MSENVKAALNANAPWREDIAWWVVLIEGLLSFGLGIYLLADQQLGDRAILWIGLYLLIVSLIRLARAFMGGFSASVQMYRVLQGGIGLIVGLLVVIEPTMEFFSPNAALIILSIGLALSGLVGLLAIVAGRQEEGMRPIRFLGPALSLIFGILLFIATINRSAIVLLQALGTILILFGVILFIRTYMLYKKSQEVDETLMAADTTDSGATEAASMDEADTPAAPAETVNVTPTDDEQNTTAASGGVDSSL